MQSELFEQLGLLPAEASVYKALLEYGKMTVTEIAKKSGEKRRISRPCAVIPPAGFFSKNCRTLRRRIRNGKGYQARPSMA